MMSTEEERREDAKREAWESAHPSEPCPACGHPSLITTAHLPATRIDPACWTGYCTCAERNRKYREGATECQECGLSVSDLHDPQYFNDTIEGMRCDCQCHCGCGFET